MSKIQHTAFYLTCDADKDWLINKIKDEGRLIFGLPVDGLQGEVFSNHVLEHFIDEEIRHDQFKITAGKDNMLSWSSSGEQRKALLAHIISKKAGYVILDNVFESLDQSTRQSVLTTLEELAVDTLLIQVFNRRNDLLPFIGNVFIIQDRMITCHTQETFREQTSTKEKDFLVGEIPAPLRQYEAQSGALVKMNDVCVQFDGRPILKDICWEIRAGEFWQLTGPNGSGKSTLLSMITGNSAKGFGQDLVLFGHKKGSGESVWELKEKIGYFTPVMAAQFERSESIGQMIVSGFYDSVGLYIKPTDRQVALADEWLALIGMYADKNKSFRLLTAVQQRMVLIARAMVKHPPLLILDEPTSGLDDEKAGLFTTLINKIAVETNCAVLYVSHRKEEGLLPNKHIELIPTSRGSVSKIS